MTRPVVVDPAWIERELAKAPKHMTAEQQRKIRAIVLPRRVRRPA